MRSSHGFAFVAVLFILLLLAGLSLGMLGEATAARFSLRHNETSVSALEMAETGLAHAEAEVRSLVDFGSDGLGTIEGAWTNGTYSVTGRRDTMNPDRFVLTATGTVGLSVRRIEEEVRRREDRMFVDALFSDDSVTLGGGTPTDAYDSRLGPYSVQAVNVDQAGPYALARGNIGSNGDIYLNGTGVRVRGNAIPGPLRSVDMSGGASVTGDVMPRLYEVPLDPTPYEDFLAAYNTNDNNRIQGGGQGNTVRYQASRMTLEVAGGAQMMMHAGTYFFSEISLKGNSSIKVTGPVKIYVTSLLDFGAGAKLIADRPGDVQFFVHPYALPTNVNAPTEARVKVNSGSSISWAMYGPSAVLDMGGGNEFFGAAVARTVSISGGNTFHYDIALGEGQVLGPAFLERLYWTERRLPPR